MTEFIASWLLMKRAFNYLITCCGYVASSTKLAFCGIKMKSLQWWINSWFFDGWCWTKLTPFLSVCPAGKFHHNALQKRKTLYHNSHSKVTQSSSYTKEIFVPLSTDDDILLLGFQWSSNDTVYNWPLGMGRPL